MNPIELIDQILGRVPFSCTEKQMRFLRDLVVQHVDPKAMKESAKIRQKKLIAALKRDVTWKKKELEAAQQTLKDAEES